MSDIGDMEIITIEKSELISLIDAAVTQAVERALQPQDEVMTLEQLCTYRKRSRATINRLVKRGLPRESDGRFKRSRIDAWLADNSSHVRL